MSAADALLIFIDPHNEFEGWLQLNGSAVVGRGKALEGLPELIDPKTAEPIRVAAVVPGETAAIHWLEVPGGLAPAQAAAAARLIASEVSAQPLGYMHVAVGPESADHSLRTVALVPAITMAGWIGRLQSHGVDPDVVIPEPLLLPPPGEGFVRYDRGTTPLYRGPTDAFSIEPELAGLITREAPVETIDDPVFEGGLAGVIANPPVNLRQGAFAKRRRWKVDWRLVRRMIELAAGILIVTLAIQVALIMKYTYATDALEIEADRIAASALPRGGQGGDASIELERRLSQLRGPGPGYAALASPVFDAIRAVPEAQLTGLVYDPTGTLRATVQGDSPATMSSLEQRIEASGLIVEVGEMRSGGGRPTAELTVRTR